MTRLFEMNVGEAYEFHLALQNAGFTYELAKRVIQNPEMAREWLKSVEQGKPLPGFVSLDEQADRLRKSFQADPRLQVMNDFDFPTEGEYVASSPTAVRMFRPYVPAPRRTSAVGFNLDVAWDQVKAPSGFTKYRWPGLKSNAKGLRLLKGKPEPTVGIHLIEVDPLVSWDSTHGASPADVRASGDPATMGGIEGLWFLRLFPEYAAVMRTDQAPNMDLPGLEVFYDGAWSYCPCVNRWPEDRKFKLFAGPVGNRGPRWASLRVRELGQAA